MGNPTVVGAPSPRSATTVSLASLVRGILPEILNAGAFQLSLQNVAWSVCERLGMEGAYLLKLEDDSSLVLQAQAGPPPGDGVFNELKIMCAAEDVAPVGQLHWKARDGTMRSMFHAALKISEDYTLILGVKKSRFLKADLEKLQYLCSIITPALRSAYRQQQLANDLVDARKLVQDTKAEQRAKSAFLSLMSHDLRTPLSVVLGFAQLLEMESLTKKQEEHVQYILRSGRQLLSLINQVLELAEVDSGKLTLQLEPVRLTTLITKCVEMLLPMAREKRLSVTFDESQGGNLWAFSDPDRLEQILLNLLSNAIKFNVKGGRVSVATSAVGNRYVQVRVSDTGPGVVESQLPRLFEPFDRLNVGSEIEGSGLGLAISRVLAQALGGSLGAESRIGRGSTFTIELPAARKPESRSPTLEE